MNAKSCRRLSVFISIITLFLVPCFPAMGKEETPEPKPKFFEYNWFVNTISQTLTPFRSPYQGANSLVSRKETEVTTLYSISGKFHFTSQLEGDISYQAAHGNAVGGNAVGAAGFLNGDIFRVPFGGLSKDPYFARYYLQWTKPIGANGQFIVSAGKQAATDIFDANLYANSSGKQFLNWALLTNPAWDYNGDTQGYTKGIALQWVYPDWVLRIGSFQMPLVANGPLLSDDFAHNRGDQAELEIHPQILDRERGPAVMKFLVYENHAHMGNYQDAINLALAMGTIPDITSVRKVGAVKYGLGFNFAQPFGDQGATGFFARYGWNNGQTESFAFTEVDRHVSLGSQVSGAHWNLPDDKWALALVQNDISAVHRNYLGAGGLGFQIGDGQLNYGSEKIVETYYSHPFSTLITVSLDYQRVANPGYNRDRGPVSVYSIRLHLER